MIGLSWALQILLATVSTLMLIPYYVAFRFGSQKYMSGRLDLSGGNQYTRMYYSGFLISLLWYVMPFLQQPRFELSVFSLSDMGGILWANSLYTLVLVALIVYFMSVWGSRVVHYNLKVTNRRFLHPAGLLTDGPYGKVRNPMIMGDLFCHLSFILLLGAVYTLCLYVVYICISMAIVHIENKYSVNVHYKHEYMEYAKKTPAYLNWELGLFAIFYLAMIFINSYLTKWSSV